MRALVTGGAGFIGSHVVDRLLADGHAVRVFDNLSSGYRENLAHVRDEIELVEGDVRNADSVDAAVSGCEVVFHQAALPSVPASIEDPQSSNATNVSGTLNVLIAARDHDVRRLVYASSCAIYGTNPMLPKHEGMLPEPISPYAVGKLAGEQYCASFATVFGFEAVALRYFNVFGPRQDPKSAYAAVIPGFLGALTAGRRPTIYGDGGQSRDFIYVGNVVDANMLAAAAPGIAGRSFNVACGRATTLCELAERLGEITGARLAPEHGDPRPGDVRHSLASIDAAKDAFGYVPRVAVQEGLERTAKAFAGTATAAAAEW